jgi:4-hydroxybenzoate polyprenyltransferase
MNTLKNILEAMRLRAWTKNSFVFAALLFGKLWTIDAFLETLAAAVGFSLLSSAVYLINDTVDRNNDRLHPEKKNRPVASGRLQPATALITALAVGAFVMTVSWSFAPWLALVYTVYFIKQIAYSLRLKHVVILDCILISLGFVLRALAGVAVLYDSGEIIELSPWLVICTFFLALLMAFAKRRHELSTMKHDARNHRKNLMNTPFPCLTR